MRPCPACSVWCHASSRVVGPCRPRVPHKRWLCRGEKLGLLCVLSRPGCPLTGSGQPGACAGGAGPGRDPVAVCAMIHEHPLAFSLIGRAGGHHAAPGVPLVPCRP